MFWDIHGYRRAVITVVLGVVCCSIPQQWEIEKTAAAVTAAAAGHSATSNISAVAAAADEIADDKTEAPARNSGPSITVTVLQVRVLDRSLCFLAYG